MKSLGHRLYWPEVPHFLLSVKTLSIPIVSPNPHLFYTNNSNPLHIFCRFLNLSSHLLLFPHPYSVCLPTAVCSAQNWSKIFLLKLHQHNLGRSNYFLILHTSPLLISLRWPFFSKQTKCVDDSLSLLWTCHLSYFSAMKLKSHFIFLSLVPFSSSTNLTGSCFIDLQHYFNFPT